MWPSICFALLAALIALAVAVSPQNYEISRVRDLIGEESAEAAAAIVKLAPRKPIVIRKMLVPTRRLRQRQGPQTSNATIKQDLVAASSVIKRGPQTSVITKQDLVAEPSHHGHHDHHGWLDMGAYSGHHGAFGWYADFPVGGRR